MPVGRLKPDMSVQQDSPAERVSTPVDGVDVLGALSQPGRRLPDVSVALPLPTIDRLPEPSPDAVRGTVYKVLEDLFDLPAERRTPTRPATCCPRRGSSCWRPSP